MSTGAAVCSTRNAFENVLKDHPTLLDRLDADTQILQDIHIYSENFKMQEH